MVDTGRQICVDRHFHAGGLISNMVTSQWKLRINGVRASLRRAHRTIDTWPTFRAESLSLPELPDQIGLTAAP